MSFTLHDSLSDRTIPLPERTPGETSLYVCGPTVYGYIHVGNARPPVVFDVLVRHLRASGRAVKYVRNYTDVDDKIIQVAIDLGEHPRTVSERFIAAYEDDMTALNCLRPDATPKVSDHIGDIIAHVEALIARGSAYATPEGDVYFDVSTFADYGKLSKRTLATQSASFGNGKAGDGKRNEYDFALWKSSKAHEPDGARWASPWGDGRPGWHIECSTMAHCHLGDHFDLHGGGQDLKFPHHENEIAQSEPVYGAPMACGWMHNGFIEVDVERNASFTEETAALLPALRERDPDLMKIAKSDGRRLAELHAQNTHTAEDRAMIAVLERKVHFGRYFQLRALKGAIDPEAIRLWILGTHYRAPLAFDLVETDDGAVRFPTLDQAEKRVEYFYDTRVRIAARAAQTPEVSASYKSPGTKFFDEAVAAFNKALDEDLNTAGALDPLNRIYERTNKICDAKKPDAGDVKAAWAAVQHVSRVTGVAEGDAEEFFERVTARRIKAREINPKDIDALVQARVDARMARDFGRADQIRAELTGKGIELRDSPTGTTWRAL